MFSQFASRASPPSAATLERLAERFCTLMIFSIGGGRFCAPGIVSCFSCAFPIGVKTGPEPFLDAQVERKFNGKNSEGLSKNL